jgi:hypothetical protein
LAQKPKSEVKAERRYDVVRDVTFSRGVADSVVVIDLDRDMEFAFLQAGQIVEFQEHLVGEDGARRFRNKLTATMTEVARIRMAPDTALQMSMQILQCLIRSDSIDTDQLLQSMNEMIDQTSNSSTETTD